ncbi:MAG: HD domain-containing protein [Acidobacteriota bacterium]
MKAGAGEKAGPFAERRWFVGTKQQVGNSKASKSAAGGKARPAPAFPLRCAAVDVGTNALRYLAVEFSAPGQFRVLENLRNAVRLGHGVFLSGRLAEEQAAEALEVLKSYRERMDALSISRYRAVATSAVRESANGAAFLAQVRQVAKIDLETIHGSEEARLVHRAVKSRIDLGTAYWMLVDLGGGSVEVSLVDASGLQWSESHTMGSVRLLEELTGSARDRGRFLRLLTEYAGTLRVRSGLEEVRPSGYIATGGNIETLAEMATAVPDAAGVSRLPVEDLARLIQRLSSLSYRERVEKLGLREDRADVILPAAIIYERLATLAQAREILVPYVGVKEGIVLDLADGASPLGAGQVRQAEQQVARTAVALGRKYHFDEPHALHVASLALSLFDQTLAVHGMGEEERRILHAAALLHDIGSFVSYTRHHKHSLYLIAHSNLAGFTPRETLMAANVARYHRRSFPKPQHEPFTALQKDDRDKVSALAALLRLADAMDREHRQRVERIKVSVSRWALKVGLEGQGDLLLEAWALKRKSDLLQKVFGRPVEVARLEKGGK